VAASFLVGCVLATAAHASAQEPAPTIDLFPAREASGTAWVPDTTPMVGVHLRAGAWDLMVHGALFGQYVYEPDDVHRTGGFANRQASSVNWGMVMARRRAGAGRVGLRAMLSAEPWTVTDCGFISYFATGEMCGGDTIHDRQHPHDLFMELSADYERPLGSSARWQVYGGLSGEPALGPPGFPHRLSAVVNPVAPIAHHWIDSTHVAFGVITTGVSTARYKIEGSLFNGRESDEHRADLDLGALDSYSGRMSFLPRPGVALQVSAAHLEEAEAQFAPHPRTDIDRVTASAAFVARGGRAGRWATTVAYGANRGWIVLPDRAVQRVSQALVLESTLGVDRRNIWFGRFELVGKPAHDLHLDSVPARILPIAKLQGGYVRDLGGPNVLSIGIGGFAAVSLVPEELEARYYGRLASSAGIFVVLRPRHRM
jgi:hypothetical protein